MDWRMRKIKEMTDDEEFQPNLSRPTREMIMLHYGPYGRNFLILRKTWTIL